MVPDGTWAANSRSGWERFGETDHPFHAHALTSGHRSPAGSLAAQQIVSTALREAPDLLCGPKAKSG